MESENKYFETGSNPYYLNLNNTAEEFSTFQDTTNPEYGFMNFLNEYIFIEERITILDSSSAEKQKEEEDKLGQT